MKYFQTTDTLQPISYSINNAIAVTGLSRAGIYKAMREGTLPFKKFGKRTMILAEDLHKYIHSEFNKQPAELGNFLKGDEQ